MRIYDAKGSHPCAPTPRVCSDQRRVEVCSRRSRGDWDRLESIAGGGYAESRPYLLPDALGELVGPLTGVVQLPLRLDWSERRSSVSMTRPSGT